MSTNKNNESQSGIFNATQRTEKWIENEIGNCKAVHYRLSRRLNKLAVTGADERLSCNTKSNGKKYFSEVWMENGVKKTRYLGSESNKEVLEIQEKRFLRKTLPMLEKKIKALEICVGEIWPLNYLELNESLPKVYRLPPEKVKEMVGSDSAEKWYLEATKQKVKDDARFGISHPEDLIHTAKDGTKMRSKSEVAIANELINREIPYIYEKPLFVNNHLMHPDFMFYSYSRMKPMIWEHAGMIGDEGYRSGFEKRMDQYMRGGFAPCVDVILTFDTTDGRLDTRIIDAIIDEYL